MQAISRQRWLWRRALLLLVAVTLIGPAFFFTDTAHAAGGTWSSTGSMATARISHIATLLSSGKVLVAGGEDNHGTRFASAELYDPASGTWSSTGSMATARAQHTATMLSSGKVLASAELFSVQEITVTAQNITATEGNVFSGTVATGTFTGISGPFSAAITWGDAIKIRRNEP